MARSTVLRVYLVARPYAIFLVEAMPVIANITIVIFVFVPFLY